MKILHDFGINLLENWPPYSPDINIIENIWAIMKSRLMGKQVTALEELQSEIIDVWNRLDITTINKLVDSIPRILQLVVEKQGDTIFLNEL